MIAGRTAAVTGASRGIGLAIARALVGAVERTLDVNVVGPFVLVRELLPDMRARRGGHLVTLGSIADRHTHAGNGAYAASKYALRALHEVLRAELKGSGVRATLVAPS